MHSYKNLHQDYHQTTKFIKLFSTLAIIVVVLNSVAIYNSVFQSSRVKTRQKYFIENEHLFTNELRITAKEYNNEKATKYQSKQTYGENVTPLQNKLARSIDTYISRKLLNTTQSIGDYPKDIFTKEQKRSGYIVLHIIGVCYMFLGLAIVCDDFFVPALHKISKTLKISDDVAGATFMAAGGSAPEFFTSFFGSFISQSNVGFGTIVGSAVFNVLFVIGMCAIFSKIILNLTWWPLLRDSVFYIIALILLIVFFQDKHITWWESLVLFLVYVLYVIFMIFNNKIERLVKNQLSRRLNSCVTPLQSGKKEQLFLTFPSTFAKCAFRHGPIQLVIHTLDPIAESAIEHKFQQIRDHCDCLSNSTSKDSLATPKHVVTEEKGEETDRKQVYLSNSVQNTNENGSPTLIHNTDNIDGSPAVIQTSNKKFTGSPLHKQTLFNAYLHSRQQLSAIDQNRNTNNTVDKNSSSNGTEFPNEVENILNIVENRKTLLEKEERTFSDSVLRDSYSTLNEDELIRHNSTYSLPNVYYKPSSEEHSNIRSSNISLRGSVRFSNQHSCVGSLSHRGIAKADSPKKRSVRNGENAVTEVDEGYEYGEEEDEEEEPIDLSWPDTFASRIYYLIKFPLVILLVITIPDVRRPKFQKLFPISFLVSILWIGGYSYLMVWWTAEIGDTLGIPVEVMGLTFLAAGTSIPDLITSVVVARQGFGDMAVSSSIGSNIFDVTVGLPVPWCIWSFTHGMKDVIVDSEGLFCSTILLFLMLLAVIITIALNKWRMTKLLGATMFFLYCIFLTVTLLIQFNIWPCPV